MDELTGKHAGSVAPATLVEDVSAGRWSTIDCGALKESFRRFGAYEVPTAELSERIWSDLGQRLGGADRPEPPSP